MTQTLSQGSPGTGDAIYIIREIATAPRLAVQAVKAGGTIQFVSNTASDAIVFNTTNPFTNSSPTLGATYTVASTASGVYNYKVGDHDETYQINVDPSGVSSAVLTWNSSSGKLRATQNIPSSGKVFFLRGEDFDTVDFAGDIKILVNGPSTTNLQLLVPSANDNGYWTPPASGNFVVQVLNIWPENDNTSHGEEVGSDEGDLTIDQPPP